MATYGWNTVAASVGPMGRQQFLTGRASRVSLMIAGSFSSTIRVSYSAGGFGDGVFCSNSGSVLFVLTFRDYGPLIQSPIFIENTAGLANLISVTELYKISEC